MRERQTDHCSRLWGAAWVVVSAIGFGTLGVFGTLALESGASIVTVLFLRFLAAGTIMTALMVFLRLPWPRGRDLWMLAGMGALGYVGQSFGYFSALRHASAGLAALLLYLYPSLVALTAAALGRQRLTLPRLALVAMSLVGILLTVAEGLAGTLRGVIFGAGAAVIYTGYILVGERIVPRTGAMAAGTVVMLAAAAVYGLVAVVEGPRWPAAVEGWLAIGGVALAGTVVPIAAFFAGVQRLGASDAATLSTLEPVVTLALAALVLGETLGPMQLAGAALVLAAVALLPRMR